MRPALVFALLGLASLVLTSCGGDNPLEPGPDTGPLTALIDGESFVAESATVTRNGSEVSVTASASGQRSISLGFTDQGPFNYLIGPGNPVSAEVTIGTSSWLAEELTGSGTITVTALTQSRIEGAFTLVVVGGPDGTTLNVTDGLFVIDFF